MSRYDASARDFVGCALVLGALGLLLVWLTAPVRHARSVCLAAGYPEVRSADFQRAWYCVRRVEQTDEVVPLERIERGSEKGDRTR